MEKKEAEQRRLQKKQAKTKKFKSRVKQELDKRTENKDIGDTDE